MIGAIVGDIIATQFNDDENYCKNFELFTDDCYFSGNARMALAVKEALTATGDDLEE